MTRSSWEGERTHSLKGGHWQRAVLSSALHVLLPVEPGVDQGAQFTVAVPRGSPSPSLAISGLCSLESGPTHGF